MKQKNKIWLLLILPNVLFAQQNLIQNGSLVPAGSPPRDPALSVGCFAGLVLK